MMRDGGRTRTRTRMTTMRMVRVKGQWQDNDDDRQWDKGTNPMHNSKQETAGKWPVGSHKEERGHITHCCRWVG